MGFIYNKPLSMEQIFSMYNSNGGDKIDKEEVANAKNIKIFQGFQVQEGWTLEDFERENLETYKRYEDINTEFLSPEYQQASFNENLQKFAEIYKKYYSEDAADLDGKIKEIAKRGTQSGEYTYANFLLDINKGQSPFGLDSEK